MVFYAKIYTYRSMDTSKNLEDWMEWLQSRGRSAFSWEELKAAFPSHSETAIRRSLDRQMEKGKLVSIHHHYYLIIPPPYYSRGILPPALFIDGLLTYLGRPYYVGLLSAAALHGAAHQQPQEFFVVTSYPVLRPTQKKGLKIHYLSKKEIPESLLERRKTETGYLWCSSPELTGADLILYERWVGGLARVAQVLSELAEVMDTKRLSFDLLHYLPVAVLQRFGYLMERVIGDAEFAASLFDRCRQAGLTFFRIPLHPSLPTKGFSSDARWKVIVNVEIALEE